MRTIWKYPLTGEVTTIPCQSLMEIRHAGIDPATRDLAVWVDVDRNRGMDGTRKIYVVPTGGEVPRAAPHFITTVIESNGLVWHVFAGVLEYTNTKGD